MIDISLLNRKALVCGASQGIGKAIAVELAALGASCVLLARNEEKLKNVILELDKKQGQSHQYKVVDFTDLENFKSSILELASEKAFDIIINNTGGPVAGLIFDAETFAFENAFRQHLICNHIIAQAIVPGMKERKWGRIINVISTSVRIPLDNLGVSNTIRAAVASWSKTLSNELAQYGITVNSLLPGFISTTRLTEVAEGFAKRNDISRNEMEERMKTSVPAKRFGDPTEIAAVAAFLASPAASYVNGVCIPVDGGRTGSI